MTLFLAITLYLTGVVAGLILVWFLNEIWKKKRKKLLAIRKKKQRQRILFRSLNKNDKRNIRKSNPYVWVYDFKLTEKPEVVK